MREKHPRLYKCLRLLGLDMPKPVVIIWLVTFVSTYLQNQTNFFYTTYVGDLVMPGTTVRCAFLGLALQSMIGSLPRL